MEPVFASDSHALLISVWSVGAPHRAFNCLKKNFPGYARARLLVPHLQEGLRRLETSVKYVKRNLHIYEAFGSAARPRILAALN